MKERTKNNLRKIAEITGAKCITCPVDKPDNKHRCCDKVFCDMVKSRLEVGIIFDEPNNGDIPYMGDKGCVVPPEYRPFCTSFVCPSHFKDRNFRKEFDRLAVKLNKELGCAVTSERWKGLGVNFD